MVSATAASVDQVAATSPSCIDEDRYLQIVSRFEQLEKRDAEKEKRDREQQLEITTLRSELNAEKERTDKLETKLAQLTHTTDHNKHSGDEHVNFAEDGQRSDVYQPTINEVSQPDQGPRSSKYKTEETTEQIMGKIRRQAEVPVVAFHATLSDKLEHLGIQQAVTFDRVITNIGGAYNPHVGSFIAPMPGVYVFSTTILGFDHHSLHCSLMKNGQRVAYLYIRGDESVYGNDSVMVVLQLNKGDDVVVYNNELNKTIHGNDYSMFSGFLLTETDTQMGIVGK